MSEDGSAQSASVWPLPKSDGNEVAIESIEIAHEGITISNG